MVRLSATCWALALVWLSAAAAAASATADPQRPAFLFDNLAPSKGSVKAKTTDYYDSYYAEPQLACLKQTSIKNCRYTGCPVQTGFEDCDDDCISCQPDSIYFQSDFNCCAKEQSYSYGAQQRMNDIGFDSKIGTCDWEISLYRCGGWDLGYTDPWCPHYTEDGSALKWGTAWGTCYLNSHAEHCDKPLCERMVISIQGGLYASCAYSPEAYSSELWDPFNGYSSNFCREERELDDLGRRVAQEYLDAKASLRQGRSPASNSSMPGSKSRSTRQSEDARQQLVAGSFDSWLDYIWFVSAGLLEGTCATGNLGLRLADLAQPDEKKGTAAKPVKAALQAGDYHQQEYYKGMTLIISGPMYVTSKKDQKVEETGMFEQSLLFRTGSSQVKVSEPINNWPVVSGYSAKVRFTKERDEYYGNGGGDQPSSQ